MEKEDIIDRKNELSSRQLFEFLAKGIITYEDLINETLNKLEELICNVEMIT